jgi:hypothetical protein
MDLYTLISVLVSHLPPPLQVLSHTRSLLMDGQWVTMTVSRIPNACNKRFFSRASHNMTTCMRILWYRPSFTCIARALKTARTGLCPGS